MREFDREMTDRCFPAGNPSRILKLEHSSKKLIGSGKEVFYKKNEFVSSPGDILDEFYYVKKGRVLAIEYSFTGRERIVYLFEKGSIFLESNVIFDIPSEIHFKAAEDTCLIRIKKKDLFNLLATDLNITLFVIKSISQKFYSAAFYIEELISFKAEWRLCNLFFELANNFGVKKENKVKIDLKISQQFISNILGINRITTVNIIKNLKRLNLIEQTDGYYHIKDMDKLRTYQTENW